MFRRNRKVAPFIIADVLLKVHTQTIILKGSKEMLAGSWLKSHKLKVFRARAALHDFSQALKGVQTKPSLEMKPKFDRLYRRTKEKIGGIKEVKHLSWNETSPKKEKRKKKWNRIQNGTRLLSSWLVAFTTSVERKERDWLLNPWHFYLYATL